MTRTGATGQRRRISLAPLVLTAALMLFGCAPASPERSNNEAESLAASAPKKLSVILMAEPENLADSEDLRLAVNQTLMHLDDRGAVHPMLATEAPSQDKGTWVVRSDGTMQTTYKLRPGITWHDGVLLTPQDFNFAWTVRMDRELPTVTRVVASRIKEITGPDDNTLVIEWSNSYPFADAIVEVDLGPLPAHVLETPYQTDKAGFMALPFWQKDFIGVGPYRVTDWQSRSLLVLQAYDRFYGPRPKIDTITFPFVYDPSVVLANLLAGAADGAIPRAITFGGTKTAEEHWQQQGKKPLVLYQPSSWIDIHVRMEPQPTPRELTDVRIRRGLLHALDRQQMVDALWEGEARVADFFMTETNVKWPWIQDVVTKYPYDPKRARELFAEGGWRTQPDGTLVNTAGEPVTLPAWATPGGTHTEALPIAADNWKSVGIAVEQFVIPRPAMTDPAFQATFRGMYLAGNPLNPFSDTQRKFLSSICPAAENNWAGNTNRGCYKNPEWDRLSAAMAITIDADAQRQLWRGMASIYTTDLPSLPVFFFLDTTIFRDGVSGVKGQTQPRSSTTWQIAEWDVR